MGFNFCGKRGSEELTCQRRIVSSSEVTKSDFTVGFCVVDLMKNEVLLVDLISFYSIFLSLKFEK